MALRLAVIAVLAVAVTGVLTPVAVVSLALAVAVAAVVALAAVLVPAVASGLAVVVVEAVDLDGVLQEVQVESKVRRACAVAVASASVSLPR